MCVLVPNGIQAMLCGPSSKSYANVIDDVSGRTQCVRSAIACHQRHDGNVSFGHDTAVDPRVGRDLFRTVHDRFRGGSAGSRCYFVESN